RTAMRPMGSTVMPRLVKPGFAFEAWCGRAASAFSPVGALFAARGMDLPETPGFLLHLAIAAAKCDIAGDLPPLRDRAIGEPLQLLRPAEFATGLVHGNRGRRIALDDGVGEDRIDRQLRLPELVHREIDGRVDQGVAVEKL